MFDLINNISTNNVSIQDRIIELRCEGKSEGRLACARAWEEDLHTVKDWITPHGTVRVIPGVSVSCAGRVWTWGQACWDLAWSPDDGGEPPYLVWLFMEEEGPCPKSPPRKRMTG